MEVATLIVDDHAICRGGVTSVLEDTGLQIVAEAASDEEALQAARDVISLRVQNQKVW